MLSTDKQTNKQTDRQTNYNQRYQQHNLLCQGGNNKDSTKIKKTIKDSNVLESFNNNNKKESTETKKTIKDSEEFGIF